MIIRMEDLNCKTKGIQTIKDVYMDGILHTFKNCVIKPDSFKTFFQTFTA